MEEHVILVDTEDQEIGTMEKMEAHHKGLLHRAFSVFVYNTAGELMLQQRAHSKYHSGGLWTNTCCSHPRTGEAVETAAHRRLMEEMGFDCELAYAFSFIYKSELDNGLTEHELDHVLIGSFNGTPQLNSEEVADWRFVTMDAIREGIQQTPENYTEWFKIVFDRVDAHLKQV